MELIQLVNISDISREAKVSKSVVSKVINNRFDVALKTRKNVMDVINRLGYVPNKCARTLSLGNNADIAVVLPSENLVYIRILLSIYKRLTEKDCDVEFHITDHNQQKEKKILQTLKSKILRGLIYFSDADIDDATPIILDKLEVPTVIIGSNPKFRAFTNVCCQESDMAELLVSEIAQGNFSEVVCLCLPENKGYEVLRNQYAKLALDKTRFDSVSFVQVEEISARAGEKAMLSLNKNESTAVLVLSNVIAQGALRFLKNNGGENCKLFVLGDMSAFDELGFSYTYVSLPIEELSKKAISLLLSEDRQNCVHLIPPKLNRGDGK